MKAGAPRRVSALALALPLLLSLPLLLTAACYRSTQPRAADLRATSAPPDPGSVRWTDVSDAAGVRFQHVNGASGRKYMPEMMGSGAAFADFTGDGRPDLFLVNSRALPGSSARGQAVARLLLNQGDGTFADVTTGSGLDRPLYGMGCSAADYDGDSRVDLYVSACLDRHRLYRNVGGGKFRDVTEQTGLGDRGWGTSCAWLDYDRDGFVDLFVSRYVRYRLGESDRDCFGPDGRRMYCDPRQVPSVTSLLYRNEDGRRFRDVSRETGIAAKPGKSLGVTVCDVDDDGWPDLWVANDSEPNFLFMNRPSPSGRRFQEIGLEVGAAMPENGEPRAGMGIDAVDLQNDGACGGRQQLQRRGVVALPAGRAAPADLHRARLRGWIGAREP
jgi:enediyne biosynthesis protein E4